MATLSEQADAMGNGQIRLVTRLRH